MLTILLVAWGGLALAAVAFLITMNLRSKRGRRVRQFSEPELSSEKGLRESLVHTTEFPWFEVQPHFKLNEHLQLKGQTLGGEPFLAILQIEPNRTLEIICLRVGQASLKARAGQKSIASVKQNASFVIARRASGEIVTETLTTASETPAVWLPEEPFSCVISSVNSLKTGTTYHLAAKCSVLEPAFIKPWEIPATYADEALLANMSLTADVAHLAERIRDVQPSRLHGASSRGIEPLRPGVCYVLGGWGGNEISFAHGCDVAILMVESFDPTTSLARFLETLSLEPLMHARLVKRETAPSSFAPMLVYPDPQSESHRVLNLAESNAMLTMRSRTGSICDLLKVVSLPDPHTGSIVFKLAYLPTAEFQNVLLWCLPERTERRADTDSATEESATAPWEKGDSRSTVPIGS